MFTTTRFSSTLRRPAHSEESLLDANEDVDLNLARGLVYGCGTVREKPVGKFRVEDLRRQVKRLG